MEQIFSNIDIYGVLAAILSAILATVVPILSFRYRKLLCILRECKKLLTTIIDSWQDRKISDEEVKQIIKAASEIVNAIKG